MTFAVLSSQLRPIPGRVSGMGSPADCAAGATGYLPTALCTPSTAD